MRIEEKRFKEVIENWEWETIFWKSAKQMLQMHSDHIVAMGHEPQSGKEKGKRKKVKV